MTLEEALAIPHKLVVDCFEGADGEWRRRAAYPELPECAVAGDDIWNVLLEVDGRRIQCLRELVDRGEDVPRPREPVRWLADASPITVERAVNGED